uniref:Uncharacterized protein n=1 Tax=Arundo donax TaxID=35708 RepID=A0A0A9FZL3_ARUDO
MVCRIVCSNVVGVDGLYTHRNWNSHDHICCGKFTGRGTRWKDG